MNARTESNPWDTAEERAPRITETREFEQTGASWQAASQLPEPDPRDGWVHRWVRVTTLDTEDTTNFSRMRREGWEPCQAQEYPELALDIAKNDNVYADKGLIEVGGLVLCRLPQAGAEQRRKHYDARSQRQVAESTNDLLRHQHKDTQMGTFVEHNQSRVSFGQGARGA